MSGSLYSMGTSRVVTFASDRRAHSMLLRSTALFTQGFTVCANMRDRRRSFFRDSLCFNGNWHNVHSGHRGSSTGMTTSNCHCSSGDCVSGTEGGSIDDFSNFWTRQASSNKSSCSCSGQCSSQSRRRDSTGGNSSGVSCALELVAYVWNSILLSYRVFFPRSRWALPALSLGVMEPQFAKPPVWQLRPL